MEIRGSNPLGGTPAVLPKNGRAWGVQSIASISRSRTVTRWTRMRQSSSRRAGEATAIASGRGAGEPEREAGLPTIAEWWLHERPGHSMRLALAPLGRYLATPLRTKHRLFVWLEGDTLADHQLVAIARDDDYVLGVLQSRVHELWALAQGTQLETRPRYTPTTTFETFPFPRPTDDQRETIAALAARLVELRDGWLNPPGLSDDDLAMRTLTDLYNEPPTWLANVHADLDQVVLGALRMARRPRQRWRSRSTPGAQL